MNYLRAGALLSFVNPSLACLKLSIPKRKAPKNHHPLCSQAVLLLLKARWPLGAQHQCFPPGTGCVPCHLLQQPVPLQIHDLLNSRKVQVRKIPSYSYPHSAPAASHCDRSPSTVRSYFSVLFLIHNTEQIKCMEESILPILKSHMKWEARPVAGVQESRCTQGKPN